MNSQMNEAPDFESGLRNLSLQDGQYYGHPSNHVVGSGVQNHSFGNQQDEDDDEPLSQQARPFSVHNPNLTRPSNFIKPPPPQFNSTSVAPDMRVMQSLYESYSQKVYFEGYVYKKNDLTVDGNSFGDPQWMQWYVELCGPVLTLWDTAEQGENVMPQYINITDSNVKLVGRSGEPGRENVFSLNSAGANQYLIDVPDYQTLINWVAAIRLSCFECSKLQEIFSLSFLSRPTFEDVLSKPLNKMEGFVQVKFSGTTDWKKYWVTVTDRKEEKKLFSKKSVQSRGQMMFYESKKSKTPVLTMVNVVQSYILYPESPQAIDLVSTFKVEGSTFSVNNKGEQTTATSYSNAIIMASAPKELVQWVIGTYDAFKLYGRPTRLNDDPFNINSLNFGEPNGDLPRLFLEVAEILNINVKDESLLDNKAQFAGILSSKMQQQLQQQQSRSFARQSQQPMGLIHQIPSNGTNANSPIPPPTNQRMSIYSNQSSNMSRSSPVPPAHQLQAPFQQQQQRSSQVPSRKIYASDEGSDDEDDEDEEDDDSDNDSVFKTKPSQTKRESLSLQTMMPAGEDDGFASSIFEDIEKRNRASTANLALEKNDSTSSLSQQRAVAQSSTTSLSNAQKPKTSDDEFSLSESEDEDERQKVSTKSPTAARRPKPKVARTQVSLSGSDEDESDDESDEEDSYSGSDDEVPFHQQLQNQPQQSQQQQFYDMNDPRMMDQQQQQWDGSSMYGGMAMDQQPHQQYYDEFGNPIEDEDGPIIPQLGDRFATQNSLLDTYRADRPSAHDQEGYARATGQPLIQVPNKPPEPRAGLVGMISQIEYEKKQKESKNRFADMEKERILERERERYIMEQRSQMMQVKLDNLCHCNLSTNSITLANDGTGRRYDGTRNEYDEPVHDVPWHESIHDADDE